MTFLSRAQQAEFDALLVRIREMARREMADRTALRKCATEVVAWRRSQR